MVFSRDDRIFIRELRESKRYGARRLFKGVSIEKLVSIWHDYSKKSIAVTGSSDRNLGSGRPRSARTDKNTADLESGQSARHSQ